MTALLRALAAILAAHIGRDDTPSPALKLDVDLPPVDEPVADEPKPDAEPAGEHGPRRPLWTCPNPCIECGIAPKRAGGFCGDACQARWIAARNRAIPLETAPPMLPDGTIYRRTL